MASLKISIECRSGLRQKHNEMFETVAGLLFTIGDYEIQIIILELLMRFGVQENEKTAKQFLKNENLAVRFRQIQRKSFEPMARPLLNALNFEYNSAVKSYPCRFMKAGERVVQKPPEDSYDQLWIDFNLGSKIIRIYCLKHPSIATDGKWDSLAIEGADILRFDISKNLKTGTQVLNIDLTKAACLLFDSSHVSVFPGSKVIMEFDLRIPIKETMRLICPTNHDDSDNISIRSSIQLHRIDLSMTPTQQRKLAKTAVADPMLHITGSDATNVLTTKGLTEKVSAIKVSPVDKQAEVSYLNAIGLQRTGTYSQ